MMAISKGEAPAASGCQASKYHLHTVLMDAPSFDLYTDEVQLGIGCITFVAKRQPNELRRGEVPALHMDSPCRSPINHHKSGGSESLDQCRTFPRVSQ